MFESLETDLYGYLHSNLTNGPFKRMFPPSDRRVKRRLRRLDLSESQIGFLMDLRLQTQGSTQDEFISFLYAERSRIRKIFPGYLSRLERVSAEEGTVFSKLNHILEGKKVALVGPSQHILRFEYGRDIDDCDVVVRLNTQWPVPRKFGRNLGSKIHVLFHCCNGDTSVDDIFREGPGDLTLICYELGVSAFRLRDLAKDFGIGAIDVTGAYQYLSEVLQTHPNTGTVATYLLLKSGLRELFIAGMTYLQTPYYRWYRGRGNKLSFRRYGRAPTTFGAHDAGVQFSFIKRILEADKRVRADSVLASLLRSPCTPP